MANRLFFSVLFNKMKFLGNDPVETYNMFIKHNMFGFSKEEKSYIIESMIKEGKLIDIEKEVGKDMIRSYVIDKDIVFKQDAYVMKRRLMEYVKETDRNFAIEILTKRYDIFDESFVTNFLLSIKKEEGVPLFDGKTFRKKGVGADARNLFYMTCVVGDNVFNDMTFAKDMYNIWIGESKIPIEHIRNIPISVSSKTNIEYLKSMILKNVNFTIKGTLRKNIVTREVVYDLIETCTISERKDSTIGNFLNILVEHLVKVHKDYYISNRDEGVKMAFHIKKCRKSHAKRFAKAIEFVEYDAIKKL